MRAVRCHISRASSKPNRQTYLLAEKCTDIAEVAANLREQIDDDVSLQPKSQLACCVRRRNAEFLFRVHAHVDLDL